MLIRRAETRDCAELVELLRASDSAAHVRLDPGDLEAALQSDGTERVFVAELSARLAGFASVQVTESFARTRPSAELTDIYVMPDSRRRGIGRKLLAAVIAHVEGEQALELFARVSVSNPAASKLYESLGLARAHHLEYRLRYY